MAGRRYVDKSAKTPFIDAALITVNAYYGLDILRRWGRNARPGLAPVYPRKSGMSVRSREWDMHDRDLCLVKKGNLTGQRVSSLNGILVSKHAVNDYQKIRRYIFDHYAFGGVSMETVVYVEDQKSFQSKQVTFVYGGNVSLINPNNEDFDAYTTVCWDIPQLDDAGYPIKAQYPGRNSTHAGLMWQAYQTTCDDAERGWIREAMEEYVRTGGVSDYDHPLKEGAAHLLDGILGCTLVVMDALDMLTKGVPDTPKELLQRLVKADVGSNKRSITGAPRGDDRSKKLAVVRHLFEDRGLSREVAGHSKGNAVVRYAESSRRINQDQNSRVVGMLLQPVKGGQLAEVQVGSVGYTNV